MVKLKIDTTINEYKDTDKEFIFECEITGPPLDVMQELAISTEDLLNRLSNGSELRSNLNKFIYQKMLDEILY